MLCFLVQGWLHEEALLVKIHQTVLIWFVLYSGCILHIDERVCFSKMLLWKCPVPLNGRSGMLC